MFCLQFDFPVCPPLKINPGSPLRLTHSLYLLYIYSPSNWNSAYIPHSPPPPLPLPHNYSFAKNQQIYEILLFYPSHYHYIPLCILIDDILIPF